MSIIAASAFADFFKENIRVAFNWNRLLQEEWPIKLKIASDFDEIMNWYTIWRIDHEGNSASYDSLGSRPLQLAEIPKMLPFFDRTHQQILINKAQAYLEQQCYHQPLQFIIPTYNLSQHLELIMDGTHKLGALALTKAPFKVLVVSVNGPIDPEILPDLQWWI